MKDDFEFSTDEELLKQARKDINKQLRDIKKNKDIPQPPSTIENILKNEADDLENEKLLVKGMNSHEVAEWLMKKHDAFIESVNVMFHTDCMDPEDYNDRALKILYMNELNNLLYLFEIEEFQQETIDYLKDKEYVDLLVILHVLNFII